MPLDPKRVLVVEDDPLYRELMCLMLADLGYQSEAVELLGAMREKAGHDYEVVFLDLMLPDSQEKTTTVKDTRSCFPRTPIAVISSALAPSDVLELLRCGADNCCVKPVLAHHLPAMIERAKHVFNTKELVRDMEQRVREWRPG